MGGVGVVRDCGFGLRWMGLERLIVEEVRWMWWDDRGI